MQSFKSFWNRARFSKKLSELKDICLKNYWNLKRFQTKFMRNQNIFIILVSLQTSLFLQSMLETKHVCFYNPCWKPTKFLILVFTNKVDYFLTNKHVLTKQRCIYNTKKFFSTSGFFLAIDFQSCFRPNKFVFSKSFFQQVFSKSLLVDSFNPTK